MKMKHRQVLRKKLSTSADIGLRIAFTLWFLCPKVWFGTYPIDPWGKLITEKNHTSNIRGKYVVFSWWEFTVYCGPYFITHE